MTKDLRLLATLLAAAVLGTIPVSAAEPISSPFEEDLIPSVKSDPPATSVGNGVTADKGLPGRTPPVTSGSPLDKGLPVRKALPMTGGATLDKGMPVGKTFPTSSGVTLDQGLPARKTLPVTGGATFDQGMPVGTGLPMDSGVPRLQFLRPVAPSPEPAPVDPACEPVYCNPGLIGYVDYLNWKAGISGQDFATFNVGATAVTTESLDFERASGIRVGLGYAFACDWDLSWNYTHFGSDDSRSVTPPPVGAGQPVALLQVPLSLFNAQAVQSVQSEGSFRLNVHDIEANWRPALNETVGFRAFGGLRWAMIDQRFDTSFTYYDVPTAQTATGAVSLPLEMDAMGLRIGAELQWISASGIRVFARGAQSLLSADFRTTHREVNSLYPAGPILDSPEHFSRIVPVLEAAMGLAWRRGPLELSGGYELSDWFNMVDFNGNSQGLFIDGFFLRLAYVR